jgi:UDP-glucose 4-epimerase
MTNILVTGANGFVGQALCSCLREEGFKAVPVLRRGSSAGAIAIGEIDATTRWQPHLAGIDVVVHLAARVHVLNDASSDPLRAYRTMNVDATLHLARQCAEAGIKRFIYLSSIKVNGEATTGKPFSSGDKPCPTDPYGVSKWEAELGLQQLAEQTGLEVVIIRPPLVYGPNVKANFLQLMRWVKRGIPLPLACVDNRRDMVYVGNLTSLIVRCCTHPRAAGRTLMVSDRRPVSTATLVRTVAASMNRKAMLLPVPPSLLSWAAKLAGREAVAQRLLASLEVDIDHTVETLNWTPPYSFEDGICHTVKQFLATRQLYQE